MGAFFRSETMTLCEMLLHVESAFECLIQLGYLGNVQFKHTHDKGCLRYLDEVSRCYELQRIMQHLQDEIDLAGITTIFYPDVDYEEVPMVSEIKYTEDALLGLYEEFMDVERNYEIMYRQKIDLNENLIVLRKSDDFLSGDRNTSAIMSWSESTIKLLIKDGLIHKEHASRIRPLGFITGAISAEKFMAFEIMLWRVCHGNFLLRFSELPPMEESAHHRVQVLKYAFTIFYMGETTLARLTKICNGFHCNLYECPESRSERMALIEVKTLELSDLSDIMKRSENQRLKVLLIASADIYIWRINIRKVLMVYTELNKMKFVHKSTVNYLYTSCWIPSSEVRNVQQALFKGAHYAAQAQTGMMFPPMLNVLQDTRNRIPPTYFKLNKFTQGFQNLIDAYGVANYRELNPAPYTIVTFPFLFAVMFGDIGHGAIMSLFAIWMITNEDSLAAKLRAQKNANEMGNILFAGRYIIVLMGIFSLYTGLIYNDIFSKSFNFFGSKWKNVHNESVIFENERMQLDPANPKIFDGRPYLFGMDPVWDAAGEHSIIMFNSLKMKLAIVLGVSQMLFGLGLGAANYILTNQSMDLYYLIIPQIVFLMCLFGYLVFLIFVKWLSYGSFKESPANSACAPSILIKFIDMLLFKFTTLPPVGCDKDMFVGQSVLQIALVVVAFLAVPTLLVGKPFTILRQKRKINRVREAEKKRKEKIAEEQGLRGSLVDQLDLYVDLTPHKTSHRASSHRASSIKELLSKEEELAGYDMGELWIHQGIHCIESILGSVSHTASYLRLWALSLAHDQLSTVLWNMVLAIGLRQPFGLLNSFIIFGTFWVWATLTVAILVVMEGLSAFLHTLRLHWVEFQSKFYTGSGENFNPFKFSRSTAAD